MGRHYLPEDFRRAALRCIEKAKRVFIPVTKNVLLERAKALSRTVIEFARALAVAGEFAPVVAKLDGLTDRLGKLEPGKALRVPTDIYLELLRANGDDDDRATARMLSRRYNCEIRYTGDGTVWFVKKTT